MSVQTASTKRSSFGDILSSIRKFLTTKERNELCGELRVGWVFTIPKDDNGEEKRIRIVKIEADKEHIQLSDIWVYYVYLDGTKDTNANTCRAWFIVEHCKRVGGFPFVFR
jgi:hypothetical protein